jgi:hypothetical protein
MKSKNQKSSSLVKDEDIKLKVNSKKHSSAMKIKLPKKLRNYEMSDPVNSEGDQPQSTNQVISNSDSTSRQNLIIPKRKSQVSTLTQFSSSGTRVTLTRRRCTLSFWK